MASQDETYDGSNLKDTEYDFPLPLLDKAQVTTLKSADQPKYNEDLAKVTSQAMNAEAADRASADAAEAKAREEADKELDNTKVNGKKVVGSSSNIVVTDLADAPSDDTFDNDLPLLMSTKHQGITRFTAAVSNDDDATVQGGIKTSIYGVTSLRPGGVLTETLADKAVTADKLADNAVTSDKLASDVSDTIGAAVTVPSTDAPGKNALDSDLFETQEVNGQTGVTLKAGAITNEYVGEGAIASGNLRQSTGYSSAFLLRKHENDGLFVSRYHIPVGSIDRTNLSYSNIYNYISSYANLCLATFIPSRFYPYTNQVNSFTYDAPNDNITSVTERYNLVSFGILSLILVQAIVVFANAGDAYVTLTKDKAWPSSGYRGVTNLQPTDFSPFLIAEGPDNPSAVSTTLAHDETNGFRLQLHSDAAGSYECEYVLGNIDKNLFTNPFTW